MVFEDLVNVRFDAAKSAEPPTICGRFGTIASKHICEDLRVATLVCSLIAVSLSLLSSLSHPLGSLPEITFSNSLPLAFAACFHSLYWVSDLLPASFQARKISDGTSKGA